jgi:hypothetical protein
MSRRRRPLFRFGIPGVAALAAAVLFAPAAPAAARAPRDVRLNQLQMIGSHNSYHLEAPKVEADLRTQIDPAGQQALEYSHLPLPDQFGQQAVRQIELDVWADPNGWLYASPLIRWATNGGPYELAMLAPGTKVLHIQDIDYHTSCLSLVACLQQVKGWSDGHGDHVPIAILLELKDTPIEVAGIPFTVPVPWTSDRMDALDAEIRSVFGEDRMITPDDVRGTARTLEQGVLGTGWPTLNASRGKVMFLMDNDGSYRTSYLAGHDSLRGRVMFTNSTPGQPDAAFVKENDPTGSVNQARIKAEVRRGYVVRTRADADTQQARTGDTSMRDAALASGAQWVSTDYPAPGMSARFGTTYVVQLPGGVPARCNPVNAPPACRSVRLEGLLPIRRR